MCGAPGSSALRAAAWARERRGGGTALLSGQPGGGFLLSRPVAFVFVDWHQASKLRSVRWAF